MALSQGLLGQTTGAADAPAPAPIQWYVFRATAPPAATRPFHAAAPAPEAVPQSTAVRRSPGSVAPPAVQMLPGVWRGGGGTTSAGQPADNPADVRKGLNSSVDMYYIMARRRGSICADQPTMRQLRCAQKVNILYLFEYICHQLAEPQRTAVN